MSTRSEKQQTRAERAKIHPIAKSADLAKKGLPSNLDAERFILGSVLLDDSKLGDVAELTPEDFALEMHRRIFRSFQALQSRGEHVDRVTVIEELDRRGELGSDGISYLTRLDDGIPQIAHIDSYVDIVQKKSTQRRLIVLAQKLIAECLLNVADPTEILASHLSQIEEMRVGCSDREKIQRVEDLESIFAKRASTDYVMRPELPVKAIVCLTGDSESGKTTLACAWARDAFRKGHAVLILDRDKNPRDRVCERLERLGIDSDGEHFRIWDCEQKAEAPQPDDPIIVNWVKCMVAQTGKSPLVVADALVNFFRGDEDENSAVDMRSMFNRCRVLTKLGATVILIHHTNRSGDARGSSDFKPACDQAFLVSNRDRDGGRLLDVITLRCEKSRYGLSGRIEYHYAGGKMLRVEGAPTGKTNAQRLQELLMANPGILAEAFEALAGSHGVGRNVARRFLKKGESSGTITIQTKGRQHHHFWAGAESGKDKSACQRGPH
jgi:hypothetical protein